jgi:hypothetical protein
MNEVVNYELYFHEDYRGNSHYEFKVEREDDEDEVDWLPCGCFSIPAIQSDDENDVRIFLIEMGDEETCTFVTSDVENGLLQLHSHINECGPFLSTGMTPGYRETGDYRAPVKVTDQRILRINKTKDFAKPTVAVEVDTEGQIIDWMSINPLA